MKIEICVQDIALQLSLTEKSRRDFQIKRQVHKKIQCETNLLWNSLLILNALQNLGSDARQQLICEDEHALS